mgnify:CR=1 FL=1
MMKSVMELAWKVSVIDVQHVLASACRKITVDHGASEALRMERAKALRSMKSQKSSFQVETESTEEQRQKALSAFKSSKFSQSLTAEEITAELVEMSTVELEKLCREFDIVPLFFSRIEMAKIFRLVNRQGGEGGAGLADDNQNNICWEEFQQVLLL